MYTSVSGERETVSSQLQKKFFFPIWFLTFQKNEKKRVLKLQKKN